jgi:hypothetical protein
VVLIRVEISLIFKDNLIEDLEEEKEFLDDAKNITDNVVKHGKTGLKAIEEELKDIVHTAEEVGKEIWEDIKGIFEGRDKHAKEHKNPEAGRIGGNRTEKIGGAEINSPSAATNSSSAAAK